MYNDIKTEETYPKFYIVKGTSCQRNVQKKKCKPFRSYRNLEGQLNPENVSEGVNIL